jgi:hypothetical protein
VVPLVDTSGLVMDTRVEFQTGQITKDAALVFLVDVCGLDPAEAALALARHVPLDEFQARWQRAQYQQKTTPDDCCVCRWQETAEGRLWRRAGTHHH